MQSSKGHGRLRFVLFTVQEVKYTKKPVRQKI